MVVELGEEIVKAAAEFEDRCTIQYSSLRRIAVQILPTMLSQFAGLTRGNTRRNGQVTSQSE